MPNKSSNAFVATIHVVLPLDCESQYEAQDALTETLRLLMLDGSITDWSYVEPPMQDLDKALYGIELGAPTATFEEVQRLAEERVTITNRPIKIWKHVATVKPAQTPIVTEFL